LQLCDSELAELMSKLREAEALLGESHELRAARHAQQKATEDCQTCRARLRALEIDMETVSARISATSDRLYGGQVSNPKELAGLQLDLENSKRSRAQVEDQLLTTMVQLEGCEKVLGDSATQLQAVDKAWQQNQERVAKQVERLRSQVAHLNENRASVAASVGKSELVLYEDLRPTKGGHAVALLEGQMCQGCRVTLSASRAQLVRKSDELVTCTNCGRILAIES
jgi:predicted  nucleic acid-binding Zn-ribbon protein